MTTYIYNMMNFSMLELTHGVRRMEFQNSAENMLGDKFIFPFSYRQRKDPQGETQAFKPPSNQEIESEITKAKAAALAVASSLGIHYESVPTSILLLYQNQMRMMT